MFPLQQYMVLISEPQLPTTCHPQKAEDGNPHQSLINISPSASIVCSLLVFISQYHFKFLKY